MLGKETIDLYNTSETRSNNNSYGLNYQKTGKELMTPDEVRMLDNRKALIFIRGERPIMDDKYPIKRHPNYRLTADGGRKLYQKRFDIPHYEQTDLSHEIDIKHLEILEQLEEIQHEERNSGSQRPDKKGKTVLFHRFSGFGAVLRHLYARFRRRR